MSTLLRLVLYERIRTNGPKIANGMYTLCSYTVSRQQHTQIRCLQSVVKQTTLASYILIYTVMLYVYHSHNEEQSCMHLSMCFITNSAVGFSGRNVRTSVLFIITQILQRHARQCGLIKSTSTNKKLIAFTKC